jgi:uncharacterized lipoprotein YajG
MKTKFIKLSIILFATVFFTACGNPKVVPATPVTNELTAEKSQENLHQMLVLLAKYKKYEILSDNGTTKMRIKYSRLSGNKTAQISSITYDVVNDNKSYTMSYADSENFGYKDGQIGGSYAWYIDHFNDVLKKMYNDPEYLARMKAIVANPNLHH